MRNPNILTIIFCFFANGIAFCQKPVVSVNLAAGPSISLGKYATQITGQTRAELAGGGLAGYASIGLRIWRSLGLMIQGTYNQNETVSDPIMRGAADYNISNPVVTTQNWNALTVTAGPTLKLSNRRIGFDGRIVAGYALVNSPGFTINGTFEGRPASVKTLSQQGTDLCYGMGSTLSWNFNDNFGLIANADYIHSAVTFTDITTQIAVGSRNVTQNRTERQAVGLLNVTGGIRVSF